VLNDTIKLPKTIYSDRNRIETVNTFIASQLHHYAGYPATLAKERIQRDIFSIHGIQVHLIDPKKDKIKQEDDMYFVAYNISVANKKRGMLLEFLGNQIYDTVLIKLKEQNIAPIHYDNTIEYERY
tara:strand:- start:527 stop:904 length:378 start_codon:yes stop_codon:yes gene_type:complete